jgi:hypothetical protein
VVSFDGAKAEVQVQLGAFLAAAQVEKDAGKLPAAEFDEVGVMMTEVAKVLDAVPGTHLTVSGQVSGAIGSTASGRLDIAFWTPAVVGVAA